MCNLILPYEVQGYLLLKRESGESPERSGHCIQRACLKIHCKPYHARRRGHAERAVSQETCLVCEMGFRVKPYIRRVFPGCQPVGWADISTKSQSRKKHAQSIVWKMSSGTVRSYSPGRVCPCAVFWAMYTFKAGRALRRALFII